MTIEEMAGAFNEWMRRYIEEPERFGREWRTINEFLQEEARGKKPSYGSSCAHYLQQLVDEIRSRAD